MQKLKVILMLTVCTSWCNEILGQQVYQSGHYGSPGTLYLYNRVEGIPPIAEITAGGENIMWDLSLNAGLNTHPSSIVTPSEGINQFTFLAICALGGIPAFDCFNTWNNTDQVLLLQDSLMLFTFSLTNLQRYQDKTANRLLETFLGFTVDLGGTVQQAVVVYQSPDTILNFPVTYSQEWMSRINWYIDLAVTGQNIQYASKQSRTSSVDAWGTIVTPFKTYTDVIRVRSEIHHEDTLTFDSIAVPINLTQLEYMWYDTSYRLPVMIATGLKTDSLEIINSVEYIYEAVCPEPTWVVDPLEDVYYLEANGTVTVDFTLSDANANEYSWDFGDGNFIQSTGNISHTFDTPGMYSIVVIGCMTHCLPLNSCTFSIIDLEIRDTTTSVLRIPGERLGIKLYPNPVSGAFTMDIPESFGTHHFRILDITGREMMNGIAHQGTNVVNSAGLPEGIFTLQLWSETSATQQTSFMRFIVLRE